MPCANCRTIIVANVKRVELCAVHRIIADNKARREAGKRGIRARGKHSANVGNVKCAREVARGSIIQGARVFANGETTRDINAREGKGTASFSKQTVIIVDILRAKPQWNGNAGDVRRLDASKYFQPGDATDAQLQRAFRKACDKLHISVLPLRDADGNETDTIPAPFSEGKTWFYRAELRGSTAALEAISQYKFITNYTFPLNASVGTIAQGGGSFTASSERRIREGIREAIEFKADARRDVKLSRIREWYAIAEQFANVLNITIPEGRTHHIAIALSELPDNADMTQVETAIRSNLYADSYSTVELPRILPPAPRHDNAEYLKSALFDYAFVDRFAQSYLKNEAVKCKQFAILGKEAQRQRDDKQNGGEIIGSLKIEPLNADSVPKIAGFFPQSEEYYNG